MFFSSGQPGSWRLYGAGQGPSARSPVHDLVSDSAGEREKVNKNGKSLIKKKVTDIVAPESGEGLVFNSSFACWRGTEGGIRAIAILATHFHFMIEKGERHVRRAEIRRAREAFGARFER